MIYLFMRNFANITSFFSMVISVLIAIIEKATHFLNDSLVIFTSIVGLIGAIIWVFIAIVKYRNEKLDSLIKKKQLENLEK